MFNRKKSKSTEPKAPRFKEIRDAYQITKAAKPWIGLAMAGIFFAAWAIGIALGFTIGHPVYLGIVSLPFAALIAFFIFTRQAGSAAYASIEGQIGAGASVLMSIRKGWTTTPAVAANKNQDMVHRSVELMIGDQADQVSLRKLQKRMKKFPKKLTPNQMREVRARLKAVGGMSMPIPKGPMATRGMKPR